MSTVTPIPNLFSHLKGVKEQYGKVSKLNQSSFKSTNKLTVDINGNIIGKFK